MTAPTKTQPSPHRGRRPHHGPHRRRHLSAAGRDVAPRTSRASASSSAAARPTWPWPRPGSGAAARSSPAPATTRSASSCTTRCAASGSTTATSPRSRTSRRRSRSARSSRPTTSRCTSTAARARRTCRSHADELDLDAIRDAKIFWVTVTGLSQEPSRDGHAGGAAGPGRPRPSPCSTWTTGRCSGPPARRRRSGSQEALPHVDRRRRQPRRVRDRRRRARAVRGGASAARRAASTLAIVKQGPKGVLAHDGQTRWSRCRRCRSRWSTASARATRSAARCATPFSLDGISSGRMRFCNAAGAIVAGRLACADAMPTAAEVEAKLSKQGPEAARG